MNRISSTIKEYQSLKRTFIVPYITPDFPVKDVSVPLILALEQSGAAMIEIGIPFSDPLADGPTIQRASEKAIKNGVTPKRVLDIVREARLKTSIPLILMGYINPILNYGFEEFFTDAVSSGVDGLIIPDLPPEESGEYISLGRKHGISTIFLIAPTSSIDRIRYIDDLSSDVSYCVSMTGVTGANNTFGTSFDEFLSRVKGNTKKPFVVGFGITSKEQVDHVSKTADGVVVGSALLQIIEKKKTIPEITAAATKFLSSLV